MKRTHVFLLCLIVAAGSSLATTYFLNPTPVISSANSTDSNSDSSDHVLYPEATEEVMLYQLFQALIPDSCKWNSSSGRLEFQPEQFTGRAKDSLDAWFGTTKATSKIIYKFPYQDDIASSYFIPLADIEQALGETDSTGAEVSGFRLYMAMRLKPYVDSTVNFTSHTLITPAYGVYDSSSNQIDYYDDTLTNAAGNEYFLDLTTPCPSACPINSHFSTATIPK